MRLPFAAALLPFAALAAGAAPPGLEGRWATVDEQGKTRAVIEVREAGGQAEGRIVEFRPKPGEVADATCEACKGADRGKPIVGLVILRLAPAEDGAWRGTVLDPEEGDTYRAVARLRDGGRTLALRGYVLLPVFGRSEAWTRLP
jgi:uncharacterized protein (DUF2147 family)